MRAAPSSMEYSVCTWRCTKFWSFRGAAWVDIVDESKPPRRTLSGVSGRVSRVVPPDACVNAIRRDAV